MLRTSKRHVSFFCSEKYATRFRLFECISVDKKKGSPEGYYAETGDEAPAQNARTGEPNERHPLYRIRRTQKTYQFLHEDCRRDHCERRPAGRSALCAAAVGSSTFILAGSDGGDAVQRMDLRPAEALRCPAPHGPSSDVETHRRRQEEERAH